MILALKRHQHQGALPPEPHQRTLPPGPPAGGKVLDPRGTFASNDLP